MWVGWHHTKKKGGRGGGGGTKGLRWGGGTKGLRWGGGGHHKRGRARNSTGRHGKKWYVEDKGNSIKSLKTLSVFILCFHTVRNAILDWCFFDSRSSSTGTKSAKLNGGYHHPDLARDFQEKKHNSHMDVVILCVDLQPGIQIDGLNRQTDVHHHTDLLTCKSEIHPWKIMASLKTL